MNDWLAILISFIFIFAVLGAAEQLRKWRGYSPDFTRKIVHVTVGMWAVGTVFLFQSRWMAIIPPMTFVVLNYLSFRTGLFSAIETGDESNLGAIYFPLAFSVIVLLFWGTPNRLVAVLMPLTWGDAAAAVLGRRFGQVRYSVLGHTRTLEGSVSMGIFSAVSVFLALIWLPPHMAIGLAGIFALVIAIAAAAVEAISLWGIDNLTIPAIAGAILYFF